MAHDKNTITISRFSGVYVTNGWHASVMPEHRKWILYEDTSGIPYLYIRSEDTTNPAGDAVERYVCDSGASGLTRPVAGEQTAEAPAGPVVKALAPIRVYEVVLDSGARQWVAATSGGHATGTDARCALRAMIDVPEAMDALFDDFPPSDPALGEDVAVLAL